MASIAGKTLKDIFGSQEVGENVRNYDFSTHKDKIDVPFAPAYGDLNDSTAPQLSDQTKIMIAGTTILLSRLSDKTFDTVQSKMLQNSMVAPDNEATVHRNDTLRKDAHKSNPFIFDSPDAPIVKEVNDWFVKIVNNKDILQLTGIDAKVLGNVISASAAKTEEKTGHADSDFHDIVFNVSALKFPDIKNEYFQLFRIKVNAWSQREDHITGFHDDFSTGLFGEYESVIFRPRSSTIDNLSQAGHDKALETFKGLFTMPEPTPEPAPEPAPKPPTDGNSKEPKA